MLSIAHVQCPVQLSEHTLYSLCLKKLNESSRLRTRLFKTIAADELPQRKENSQRQLVQRNLLQRDELARFDYSLQHRLRCCLGRRRRRWGRAAKASRLFWRLPEAEEEIIVVSCSRNRQPESGNGQQLQHSRKE
ncbi:hypothetical protein RvY_04016-2 [Ramazzottius varieornatus]|uniref:Uncharacterized protein n=1 Tax=Ramazzottius varieornatus TaxID=947166 RepID=A0A1D1UQ36_RAMVA|nr:hypothetical protein RvY_04016-2 [Ramazzottius varieornatus]